MTARLPRHTEDPAADAAHLITRLAIALLLIVAPIASVGTRRAIYVLVPVGVALTLVAARASCARPCSPRRACC